MSSTRIIAPLAQLGNAGGAPRSAPVPAAPDPRLELLRAAERALALAESAALGAPRGHDGDRRRARVDECRRAVIAIRAAWRQPLPNVAG